MDKEFTLKLQAYMNQPEQEREINEGATMLLQMNRNRVLFQNILRAPHRHKERLFSELNKFLKIRLDGMTIDGIVEMQKQIPEIESETIAKINLQTNNETGEIALGKRDDHDSLPEIIQALWVENGTLARRIKSLHEKLKLMEREKPCDRYEFLQELVTKDRKYRENWEQYDNYVLVTQKEDNGEVSSDQEKKENTKGTNETPADITKRISRNRKFISDNKGKLSELNTPETLVKYMELKQETQLRYDQLVQDGINVSDKQKAELSELGLKV